MALFVAFFDHRKTEAFREKTKEMGNVPALTLIHTMRICPSDLSHRKNMKKSIGQFAEGDTMCKTCRRRAP
jgi:hypothetical protein